jgi:hypothetical protein
VHSEPCLVRAFLDGAAFCHEKMMKKHRLSSYQQITILDSRLFLITPKIN